MLHGIKLLVIVTLLSLFPKTNANVFVETLEKDDSIVCKVSNVNLKKITCEVNGHLITSISGHISIPKSEIKGIGAQILLMIENTPYHLVLSFLGDLKNVVVNDSIYYIGYHLKSYSENITIINNLSYKIEFLDLIKEKELLNIFSFTIKNFKGFFLNEKIEDIKSVLYIFLDKDVFPYLSYNFSRYEFPLSINYEKEYCSYSLKNKYELINNNLVEKSNGKISDIIFPNNFANQEFFCSIQTTVLDVTFILNYHFKINLFMNDDNTFVVVEKYNEDIKCDKTIISTY